jgi:hypothetical protein
MSGLCAFAPKENGKRAWSLLVDEVNAHRDINREKLRPHFPTLKFNLADSKFVDAAGAETRRFRGANALVDITGFDVFILPGGKEEYRSLEALNIEGFDSDADVNDLPIPESGSPSGSFAYLGCIERACSGRGLGPGGGTVIPDLVKEAVDPKSKSNLASRIHLTAGDLSVNRFGADENNNLVVWRFRPFNGVEGQGDHRQLLASRVRLSLPIHDDFVRIEIVDFSTLALKAQIDIRPGSDGSDPVVGIFNEESDQFFKNPPHKVPRLKKPRKQDRILESYFGLVRRPPALDQRPIPVRDYSISTSSTGEPADSSPPCSPVRLSGV